MQDRLSYSLELMGGVMIIQSKLSDAKMFCPSFSDVLSTDGVKFE